MIPGTIVHNALRFDLTSGITASVTKDKFKRWAFSFQLQMKIIFHIFGNHIGFSSSVTQYKNK